MGLLARNHYVHRIIRVGRRGSALGDAQRRRLDAGAGAEILGERVRAHVAIVRASRDHVGDTRRAARVRDGGEDEVSGHYGRCTGEKDQQ